MRISFILSSLRLSGGVRVVVEYANGLAVRGHQIALVVPANTIDEDIASEVNEKVEIIQANPLPKNSFQKVILALSLARAVPPSDLVISTHSPTTVANFLSSHILGKGKPIWLCQDYPEMFSDRPIESWLFQHATRWHLKTLVVSHYLEEELGKHFPENVFYVGEGLSHTELFKPMLPENRPTQRPFRPIFFLGDERPRKGLNDFLQAAELVKESHKDIRLWIASKSPCKIPTSLPFDFYLRPSTEELATLYATCEVFVFPSWWEGFGLPPLEAMACGAPVVLTDSRGVCEYAQDGINCLMVPPRNPQALAEGIRRILSDASLATRLRQNGPRTAKLFTWETAMDRFEEALSDLFASADNPPSPWK